MLWATCQILHVHATKLYISLQELLHFTCNSSFHIRSQKVYKFLFEATGGTPLFFERNIVERKKGDDHFEKKKAPSPAQ